MSNLAIALLSMSLLAATEDGEEPYQPNPIVQCLGSPKSAGLTVLFTNPYYLRGDFDGDGRPDYALRVRRAGRGTGVLICGGNGAVFLLGAGLGDKRFSNKEGDNFLAPQWEVATKADISALSAFRRNVPHPIPVVKGEAIAMVWEDGIALIYWDGGAFRWAGPKS